MTQKAVFIEEEESRFQKKFQEEYDITSDNCYNQWIKKHQSSNDGREFVDQDLDLSPQLTHNVTFSENAISKTCSCYVHNHTFFYGCFLSCILV